MSGEKITLEDMPEGVLPHGWKATLPEGTIGMRIYGTGLPKEGVFVSREEIDAGVVAVASGPPRGGGYGALNGSVT